MKTVENIRLEETIDVTPGMITYNLFENFPYTMTRALCEFIDNALHAFLEHKEKMSQNTLNIQIKFFSVKEQRVEIHDNGIGIPKEDFQKAFELAQKKQAPGMSEFGLGMKAAAFWFSTKFIVSSTPYGLRETYYTEFDLDKQVADNIRTIKLYSKESADTAQGVVIELSKLRRELSLEHIKSIWAELQDIYQIFTHTEHPLLNLSIQYNNISLSSTSDELLYKYRFPNILVFPKAKFIDKGKTLYAIGKMKKWEVDINFSFDNKQVIGKMYLLKISSQKENPGIRLFREKRLLKGFFAAPYRPVRLVGTANKHAPSRVFAELHVDGQPVSVNKSELLIDENLFLDTLKKQIGVQELIEQAEEYRAQTEPTVISEDKFAIIEKKKPMVKQKKATFKLHKNTDQIETKTDIDLYEYIKLAENSKGEEMSHDDIIIEVDGKQYEQPFRQELPSQKVGVRFYFVDGKKKIEANLSLVVVSTPLPANFVKMARPLIPHIAHESYKLQLGAIIPNLVNQINELYRKKEYVEVITCGLRACFEIPLMLIRESKDIKFDPSIKSEETESAVLAIHNLLANHSESKKIAELITKRANLPSYKNFLNMYKGIGLQDVSVYIKQAHLGAHGASTSLLADKLEGLGNYIGLFLLLADQVLNNAEIQNIISKIIPKPIV